jgi:hypothetical protein
MAQQSSQTQTRCLKKTTEKQDTNKRPKTKAKEEEEEEPNSTRRSLSPPLPRKNPKVEKMVDK